MFRPLGDRDMKSFFWIDPKPSVLPAHSATMASRPSLHLFALAFPLALPSFSLLRQFPDSLAASLLHTNTTGPAMVAVIRVMDRIATYDFEACRPFLEHHTLELAETADGLDKWATFRELIYTFTYESLARQAPILGQFDPDLVYAFVPVETLAAHEHPTLWAELSRVAACLMKLECPPYAVDFFDVLDTDRRQSLALQAPDWLRTDFMDSILLTRRAVIWVFFAASRYFDDVLLPQLAKRGFVLAEESSDLTASPLLRVRHPHRPKMLYKIPWADWVCDMIAGGYNLVFLMACSAIYLRKLENAVARGEDDRV